MLAGANVAVSGLHAFGFVYADQFVELGRLVSVLKVVDCVFDVAGVGSRPDSFQVGEPAALCTGLPSPHVETVFLRGLQGLLALHVLLGKDHLSDAAHVEGIVVVGLHIFG